MKAPSWSWSERALLALVYGSIAYLIGAMLAGCVEPIPPPVLVEEVDAAAQLVDAQCISVETCIANDVRIQECKHLCSTLDLRCLPDGSGSDCWQECFDHGHGTYYCPFGME